MLIYRYDLKQGLCLTKLKYIALLISRISSYRNIKEPSLEGAARAGEARGSTGTRHARNEAQARGGRPGLARKFQNLGRAR